MMHGFYFRTKIVLVDDNKPFLDNLSLKLSEKYIIETYNNPADALKAIHENIQNSPMHNISSFMTQIDDEDNDDCFIINFDKLHEFTDTQIKYRTISVVVADYSMPSLNGIDFCKLISDSPVLKIMLTGYADYKLAVEAINRQIIDKFIIKDSDSMLTELTCLIDIYQKELLCRFSNSILPRLSSIKGGVTHSNEYKRFFKQIADDLSIVEYYPLNSIGTYLLVSKNGERYYFSWFNDNQLEEYLDIAENIKANVQLIDKIKEKTHAPILIKKEHYKIPASNWEILLHPITYNGSGYYSVISENTHIIQS